MRVADYMNSTNSNLSGNISFNFKETKFKFTAISVKHFIELQKNLDKLKQDENLSNHKNFRVYLDKMNFTLPEDFPTAKYVLLLVRETKLGLIDINYKGNKCTMMISPGYFGYTKYNPNEIIDFIKEHIIKSTDYRFEHYTGNLHMKSTIVRSGLGRYGRNNLSYVDGMGSFIALLAFLTDYDFENEQFFEMQLMDSCENCRICVSKCPTQAIIGDSTPIDVDKCISLYNENPGEFPKWLEEQPIHNALFGCMRCQMYCPANSDVMKAPIHLGELTEEETTLLLNGEKDDALLISIEEKLQMPLIKYQDYYLPMIQRNLAALLKDLS